jgi:lysyl-tRNA synthetase class 2
MGREEQIVGERMKKLAELRKKGINPYPHKFGKEDSISKCLKSKTGTKVKTAGRVISKRGIGKIIFADLQDSSGKMQVVLQDGETPAKAVEFFGKYIDTGDIIGIGGKIFRTKTGQLSILAKSLELLGKSILPLPSQWHGLQDKEERYRKRYLDLIMNPEAREVFRKREKIIDTIREFLKKEGVTEVETPLLQPLYGGAEARPFVTNLHALNLKQYLSISPELYLKRLIAGDFEGVFTICKNFRNEGIDRTHNPEFTMMEIYRSYADYNDMMKLTEDTAKKLHGKTVMEYQGKKIDFRAPFKRMTLFEAIKKFGKANPEKMSAEEIDRIFEEKVQPNLVQPTFITDYPIELCPLTKEHRKNSRLVERFELFINGMEMANAYSELNDPIEQKRRLVEQMKSRKAKKDFDAHAEAGSIDEDFIESMSYGMPPLGGVGIGIDRLVMLLTNSASIRDVILFPFMKPEND